MLIIKILKVQNVLDKGLLRDDEHFFEISKNPDLLTINFTEMDDETYYKVLYESNEELIDCYHDNMKQREKESFSKLYFKDDDSIFSLVDHRNIDYNKFKKYLLYIN